MSTVFDLAVDGKKAQVLPRDIQLDPVKDLRPICPNCHAMIHRREPPYTIEDLRVMLRASV